MVVECSFGSITSKFRILHKSIETNVTNAVHIVKAVCLLHNIIRDLESINETEFMSFRKAYKNMSQTPRHNSQRRYNATSRAAAQARENFKLYFEQHPLPRV